MEHTDTFGYALRKHVRNNPIVRDVDEGRQRELRSSLAIGVAFVALLVFNAWEKLELVRHGYEAETMERARVEEIEANRHLRLESESLRAPQRIEHIATTEFGMRAPTSGDTIVLERVLPSDPPATSVVASR